MLSNLANQINFEQVPTLNVKFVNVNTYCSFNLKQALGTLLKSDKY